MKLKIYGAILTSSEDGYRLRDGFVETGRDRYLNSVFLHQENDDPDHYFDIDVGNDETLQILKSCDDSHRVYFRLGVESDNIPLGNYAECNGDLFYSKEAGKFIITVHKVVLV
jgi:hypothetical protein